MTLNEYGACYQAILDNEDAGNTDEYGKFDRVNPKRSQRPDLHAFLLLDELVPEPGKDIVTGAKHGEFYLSIDVEELAKVITKEQVLELRRCGVRYDSHFGCLAMFS